MFEVDPKCIELIHKNLKANQLNNVEVHNYAVSDSKGTIKIPNLKNPNPSLVINSNNDVNYLEIESISVDEFVAQQGITPKFIKIDVEGAEWQVLCGMKKIIAEKSPNILVEIHVDKLRQSFDTDYKIIIEFLLNAGYAIEEIEHRNANGNPRKVDLDTQLKGNTMVLCTQ